MKSIRPIIFLFLLFPFSSSAIDFRVSDDSGNVQVADNFFVYDDSGNLQVGKGGWVFDNSGNPQKFWPKTPPVPIGDDVSIVTGKIESGGVETTVAWAYPSQTSLDAASLVGYTIDGYAIANQPVGSNNFYPFMAITKTATSEKFALVYGKQNWLSSSSMSGITLVDFDFSLSNLIWNVDSRINGVGPTPTNATYTVINPSGVSVGGNTYLQWTMSIPHGGYIATAQSTAFHNAIRDGLIK